MKWWECASINTLVLPYTCIIPNINDLSIPSVWYLQPDLILSRSDHCLHLILHHLVHFLYPFLSLYRYLIHVSLQQSLLHKWTHKHCIVTCFHFYFVFGRYAIGWLFDENGAILHWGHLAWEPEEGVFLWLLDEFGGDFVDKGGYFAIHGGIYYMII